MASPQLHLQPFQLLTWNELSPPGVASRGQSGGLQLGTQISCEVEHPILPNGEKHACILLLYCLPNYAKSL